jgi:hypothetical protein
MLFQGVYSLDMIVLSAEDHDYVAASGWMEVGKSGVLVYSGTSGCGDYIILYSMDVQAM